MDDIRLQYHHVPDYEAIFGPAHNYIHHIQAIGHDEYHFTGHGEKTLN